MSIIEELQKLADEQLSYSKQHDSANSGIHRAFDWSSRLQSIIDRMRAGIEGQVNDQAQL